MAMHVARPRISHNLSLATDSTSTSGVEMLQYMHGSIDGELEYLVDAEPVPEAEPTRVPPLLLKAHRVRSPLPPTARRIRSNSDPSTPRTPTPPAKSPAARVTTMMSIDLAEAECELSITESDDSQPPSSRARGRTALSIPDTSLCSDDTSSGSGSDSDEAPGPVASTESSSSSGIALPKESERKDRIWRVSSTLSRHLGFSKRLHRTVSNTPSSTASPKDAIQIAKSTPATGECASPRKQTIGYVKQLLKPKNCDALRQVLLQGKLFVPAILGSLSSLEDIDEVPAGFAWVFFAADTGAILLRSCISSELANTDSISLLFREETAYVRAISSFIHIVGIKFLRNTVVKFIKMILRSPPIELNNVSNDELMRNRNNLSDLCTAIMMQLVANVEQYPHQFREVFSLLQEMVNQKFPGLGWKAVGSFFFLRFLSPALVTPEKFHLVKGRIASEERRKLILVSKILQLMANETDFQENKDPTTRAMESLVRNASPFLQLAYNNLVDLRGDPSSSGWLPKQIEQKSQQSIVDILFFVATNKAHIEAKFRELLGDDDQGVTKHMNSLDRALSKAF